jgi:transcriptional regulator with XRE-family HTH domain
LILSPLSMRRLGLHPSSLTRIFNGQVETKFELLLGIARVLGLEYGELFEFVYPARDEESEAARKVRSLVEGLKPAKSRPPTRASQPALEELMQQLLKRLKLPAPGGDAS